MLSNRLLARVFVLVNRMIFNRSNSLMIKYLKVRVTVYCIICGQRIYGKAFLNWLCQYLLFSIDSSLSFLNTLFPSLIHYTIYIYIRSWIESETYTYIHIKYFVHMKYIHSTYWVKKETASIQLKLAKLLLRVTKTAYLYYY